MLQKILNLLNFQKVRHSTENSGDTGTNIDRDNSEKKVSFFLFCLFVCLFSFFFEGGGGVRGVEGYSAMCLAELCPCFDRRVKTRLT